MRVPLCTRVSTKAQDCELQPAELLKYISRRSCENAGGNAYCGWGSNEASRPEFSRLSDDASNRLFDVVLDGKLDRFDRSLLNYLAVHPEPQVTGVRSSVTTQKIDADESNPASRLPLHIVMSTAKFDQEPTRERARAKRSLAATTRMPARWARKQGTSRSLRKTDTDYAAMD